MPWPSCVSSPQYTPSAPTFTTTRPGCARIMSVQGRPSPAISSGCRSITSRTTAWGGGGGNPPVAPPPPPPPPPTPPPPPPPPPAYARAPLLSRLPVHNTPPP